MTGRWLLALAAPLSLLAAPAVVLADEPPGCPPDEWFCDDSDPAAPEPGAADSDAVWPGDEAPPTDADADEPPEEAEESGAVEVAVPPAPPSDDRRWGESERSPWGFALRTEGVLLDSGSDKASLWGVGASMRYTLNQVVTLDLGLDTIVGTDYNGYDRSELSLSASSLLYLNQSDIVRTFVLVGLSLSSARVDLGIDEQSWGYFGGHTGLGLEFVLDARIGLTVDAVAFMRGRTDSRAAREPEFTDGSGRVSNTSGGGLLRAGVVLRF